MLLTTMKTWIFRNDNQAYVQKNADGGSDKQDTIIEDPNSADMEIANRSKKHGLLAVKKENSLTKAAERLKNYAGLGSDGSGDETNNFSNDSEGRPKSKKPVMEKKISGLKEKVYSKSDWIKIIKDNDLETTPNAEMYASLRHGIPSELRPRIWRFLANIEKTKAEYPSNYYKELARLNKSDGDLERQIKLDVSRTFPTHILFAEKEFLCEVTLARILRAYAKHDPAVGYVQGLNFIAGALLAILHPANYANSKSRFFKDYEEQYEEDVFWILIHLMFDKNWRSIYKPDFPKVREMCRYFEKLMQTQLKDIHLLILDNGFSVFDLFHQAFITLMTSVVPLTLSKRVLDLFLIEGEKLIFKVLLRALALCEDQILEAKSPTVTFAADITKLTYLLEAARFYQKRYVRLSHGEIQEEALCPVSFCGR